MINYTQMQVFNFLVERKIKSLYDTQNLKILFKISVFKELKKKNIQSN